MLGRGIDQILQHPSSPELSEPFVRDARDYVALAEATSGPIPHGVAPEYVWGELLGSIAEKAPSARIVNLETSITTASAPDDRKSVHYRMNPANAECVSAARIDACVLANNHVLDYGERGLVETLDVLGRVRVASAGAGRSLEEARRPAIVDAGGRRVLVFGLADDSAGVLREWAAGPRTPGVELLADLSDETADAVAERVRSHRRPGDMVVVSIHWGSNWGYQVPRAHERFARALIDRGADLVHGHSSHHARPMEIYSGRLILYGCGDLINDYEGIDTRRAFRSELVAAYFPELDDEGRLIECVVEPFRLRKLRLERATTNDTRWLRDTLERISTRLPISLEGSRIVVHRAR